MIVILIIFRNMIRGMPANSNVAFLRYVPVDGFDEYGEYCKADQAVDS
jgi:hypothetical protein